jgi:S1-C subfamily serine protease
MTNLRRNVLLLVFSTVGSALVLTCAGAPEVEQLGSPTAATRGISTGVRTAVAQAVTPVSPASVSPDGVAVVDAPVLVYERNGASVVNITSLAIARTVFGTAQQTQGVGSGFILDESGRIVTNNHVVQDADQLAVTFQDRSTTSATLLGRDPDNDLAVIQVDPHATDDTGLPIAERLRPVALGDSDRVRIGEQAIAIGSPLGLQQTITAGIVSARRSPGEEGTDQLQLIGGAIQTDAAINPGNSGGPLFDSAGQVIGVNSAILSQSGGYEGIGFAIPINVVKRVVPDLIQQGRYAHPQLGVTTVSLSLIGQSAKQQLGLPTGQRGLLVQDVTAGAAQAGIRGGSRTVSLGGVQLRLGGDIIVALDGQTVSTGGELRGYIENNKRAGDALTVSVLRNTERLDFVVTLTERPQQ